jgi:serine/threonine protein phosphatase PrpC
MNFTTQSFSLALESRPNQDAMTTKSFSSDKLFAAVADGVGGQEGGAIASNMTIECVENELTNESPSSFGDVFAKVVKVLQKRSIEDDTLKDMATTLSLLIACDGQAHFAHVGDSRIYHLRNKGILQITQDQTEVALLVRQGILSANKAKTYARRSVLVSALSAKGDYELISGSFDIQPKDRILLITDGVYGLMSKQEIRDFSIKFPSLAEFTNNISLQLSLRGLKDDATLVAIEVS